MNLFAYLLSNGLFDCSLSDLWFGSNFVFAECLGLSVVSSKNILQLKGEKVFLLLITVNSVNSLLDAKAVSQSRVDPGDVSEA